MFNSLLCERDPAERFHIIFCDSKGCVPLNLSSLCLVAVASYLFVVFCSQGKNEGILLGYGEQFSPDISEGMMLMEKDKNSCSSFSPTQLHCVLLTVLWMTMITGNTSQ